MVYFFLTGCAQEGYAPVIDAWHQPGADATYRVKSGDTLYSIAWAFDLDYRTLAEQNQLEAPYALRSGQLLNLAVTRSSKPPAALHPQPTWHWPVHARVVSPFSNSRTGNKGIDFAANYGAPVYAAAEGTVVYSGQGVRGYGNLIIVKHNTSYLSAYAFNKRILVREGSRVRAGQQIAEIGRNDAGRALLHFEIRLNGKPVNPILYLK